MAYDPRKYFDDIAQQMKSRDSGSVLAGKDNPFHVYKRARILEVIRTIDFRGRKVLEIGPGAGINLMLFHSLGAASVSGCDVSPQMMEVAKANLARNGLKDVEIKLTDGSHLPFPDRTFDFCLTLTVLQHNSDEAALLTLMGEIARCAATDVFLIEDTARVETGWPSYTMRPVEWYAERMKKFGFDMASARAANTAWSERACENISKILRDPSRHEGGSARASTRLVMSIVMLVTKLMDRFVPASSTITCMNFRRA